MTQPKFTPEGAPSKLRLGGAFDVQQTYGRSKPHPFKSDPNSESFRIPPIGARLTEGAGGKPGASRCGAVWVAPFKDPEKTVREFTLHHVFIHQPQDPLRHLGIG